MPPSRCDVLVELVPGEVRTWRMTLAAIDELEHALEQLRKEHVPFSAFRSDLTTKWKAKDWALYLWAGLHATDPALTYEQVQDLTTTEVLDQFQLDAVEMMQATLPRQAKKKLAETEALSKSTPPQTSSPQQ